MSSIVQAIRKNIAEAGGSEAKAIAANDGLRSLWEHKQRLLMEMNKAKKAAAEAAAEPFLEEIEEIDRQYAFLLQMVGENGDST